jgi:uncharacterized membrane protein YuzA (DUF378 family)
MAERREGTTVLAQVLLWIAIIGAINWGLVGFFDFDLVRAIFGGSTTTDMSGISRVIYALVGLAGLGLVFLGPMLRARGGARIDRPAHARV